MMITVLIGILYLFRFIFGACIFSFLTVVIFRLPKGEELVYGRSHCPGCGRVLGAGELIPCISYLVQGGKCLGCGMKISGQYFLVECLGGLAFITCSACFGSGESGFLSLRGWVAFSYMAILTVVAFIDWNTKIIYDRFHIFIALLGIAAIWLFPEHTVGERLIGAVIVAVPMLILALLIDGAFGGGDIKLMAVSGWLLGWRAMIPAIFIGIITGGIYCLWMLARGKMTRKTRFAFGPFLAIGLAVSYIYGEQILTWYLSVWQI